jgi:hypothetical protein
MACLYTKCLRPGQPRWYSAQIQISTQARRDFVLQNAPTISEDHPASSYGQTAWDFEFYRSPPHSAEVDDQSRASTAAIGLQDVKKQKVCLILYKVLGKIFGSQGRKTSG